MDGAYTNALKRKEELEKELREVDTFLSLYQRFRGSQSQESAPDSQPSPNDVFVNDGWGRRVRALRPPEIADIAERVIRAAGEPLTRAQIVDRMESAGHVLNSDDKPRYVGTILWRQKHRFTNITGQGYVMSDMASAEHAVVHLMDSGESEDDSEYQDAGQQETD